MTITFNPIWIPIIFTVFPLCYSMCMVEGKGQFGVLDNIVSLIFTLPIALIAWILYGVFK